MMTRLIIAFICTQLLKAVMESKPEKNSGLTEIRMRHFLRIQVLVLYRLSYQAKWKLVTSIKGMSKAPTANGILRRRCEQRCGRPLIDKTIAKMVIGGSWVALSR